MWYVLLYNEKDGRASWSPETFASSSFSIPMYLGIDLRDEPDGEELGCIIERSTLFETCRASLQNDEVFVELGEFHAKTKQKKAEDLCIIVGRALYKDTTRTFSFSVCLWSGRFESDKISFVSKIPFRKKLDCVQPSIPLKINNLKILGGDIPIPSVTEHPLSCYYAFRNQCSEFLQQEYWKKENTSGVIEENDVKASVVLLDCGIIELLHPLLGFRYTSLCIIPPTATGQPWRCIIRPPVLERRQNLSAYKQIACVEDIVKIFTSYVLMINRNNNPPYEKWECANYYQPRILLSYNLNEKKSAPPLLRKFISRGGVLLLTGPCASGKTHFVEQFVGQIAESGQHFFVLDISPGRNLVWGKLERWKTLFPKPGQVVTCYDIRENKRCIEDALIVISTRDSLDVVTKMPSIVFGDETDTFLTEYYTPIMIPRAASTLNHLQDIFVRASHIIFGEAVIDEAIYPFIEDVHELRKSYRPHLEKLVQEPPVTFIRILKNLPTRHFIFTLDDIYNQIMDGLQQRKHPIVITGQTVKRLEQMVGRLDLAENDCCLYTQKTEFAVKQRYLGNEEDLRQKSLNDIAGRVRVVAFSPVIRPGTNITHPFHCQFSLIDMPGLDGSVSNVQRFYRVRNLIQSTVLVSLQKKNHGLLHSFNSAAREEVVSYENVQHRFFEQHLSNSDGNAKAWPWLEKLLRVSCKDSPKKMESILTKSFSNLSITDIHIEERLHADIIILKNRKQICDEVVFGLKMLDYIRQNGDTYLLDFDLPDDLKQFLVTTEVQNHQQPVVRGDGNRTFKNDIDTFFNFAQVSAICNAAADGWPDVVAETHSRITGQKGAMPIDHFCIQTAKTMTLFGIPQLEKNTLEAYNRGLSNDQFLRLRNAFLGQHILPLESCEFLKLHHFLSRKYQQSSYEWEECQKLQGIVFLSKEEEEEEEEKWSGLDGINTHDWLNQQVIHKFIHAWLDVVGLKPEKSLMLTLVSQNSYTIEKQFVENAIASHPWFNDHENIKRLQAVLLPAVSSLSSGLQLVANRSILYSFGIKLSERKQGSTIVFHIDCFPFSCLIRFCQWYNLPLF